ncbi:MAG TPA: hypothetical protein VG759_26825 [Candidatus Angelobacter sp.]|jgi:hypothetical protein|nr:hypothetical protein [Candidatus Angelobacter sp.]
MPENPNNEPMPPAKKPVGANAPSKPLKESLSEFLIGSFKEQNHWIHAIAVGFLQEGPGVVRVKGQYASAHSEQRPEPIVFVDRAAPKCVVREIDCTIGRLVPSFFRLSTSRFVGLANPGDSISPLDPSEFDASPFNVSPFSAGTLGAVVQVGGTGGQQYLLGSNHVLAYNGRVQTHEDIVTPGRLEDITGGSKIGSSFCFVPLDHTTTNSVDCALAQLQSPVPTQPMTSVKPIPFGTSISNNPLLVSSPIKKFGRTTQSTAATLNIYSWQGSIDFSFGTFDFDDMLAAYTQHNVFAAPGDSGALAFDPSATTRQGVGLVTARAYSFDPSNQRFVSYIIVMCRLDNVADALASAINNANNGATSFNGNDLEFYFLPNRVK